MSARGCITCGVSAAQHQLAQWQFFEKLFALLGAL
jgi:hypothetical protein